MFTFSCHFCKVQLDFSIVHGIFEASEGKILIKGDIYPIITFQSTHVFVLSGSGFLFSRCVCFLQIRVSVSDRATGKSGLMVRGEAFLFKFFSFLYVLKLMFSLSCKF